MRQNVARRRPISGARPGAINNNDEADLSLYSLKVSLARVQRLMECEINIVAVYST